ncbi:MAG: PDZ domain-containing protein, partial [Halioglobus sp.]|nr:PDZ domain-containing protein [Halioglobus sp.]
LAVVAYWFFFIAGESGYAPVIGAVEAGSVADVAGLESGQEIVAVDGAATPTWQALSFRLLDRIGDTGIIRFAVKYPDSDVVYESGAAVQQWLADQEQPDLFGGLGIAMYTPEVPPVVSQVVADSPAQAVGLREGDRILRADGVTMSRWMDWVDYVRARPARPIVLEFERDGQVQQRVIVPELATGDDGETFGRVGLAVALPRMPPEMIRKF